MRKKKTYTLFFSWQSDTRRHEREIIERAINEATQYLEHEYGYKILVDHSNLGDSGMPNITQTILRKIDNCDLFLCDLTPVHRFVKDVEGGRQIVKQLPNSNVLVELGYAMSALGVEYIIPLAHRGDWLEIEMPFDINHNRIVKFTQDTCDLKDAIRGVVEYIRKNGRHRHKEDPFLIYTAKRYCEKFKDVFVKEYKPTKIHESSTSFFAHRMAKAFPGERGLVEYTSDFKINRCLKHLLAEPLKFDKAVGYGAMTDPIWWSRGSDALDISQFKRLGYRRYLIGWEEVKIKRIVAYTNYAKYYSEYVYIETYPDTPTGLYKYTDEEKEYSKNLRRWDEEYGVFKLWGIIPIKVTRNEFDDGHKVIFGRTIYLGRNSELRIRYLKPYNFILSAKKSAYYNQDFEMTSDEMFDKMLEGKITAEEFNKYMMKFPKPWD